MSAADRRGVRPVSEAEVASFADNGWVVLRELISADWAAELLERAQQLVGVHGQHNFRAGYDYTNPSFQSFRDAWRIDADFATLAREPALGRNAASLLGWAGSARLFDDSLLVKLPAQRDAFNQPTAFHQDRFLTLMFDMSAITIWIALDEIPPARGPMQFYSGSHKLGLLGWWDVPDEDVLQLVPQLASCPRSEPPNLRPGDATVHHGLCVHGAPANTTDRPRWAYRVAYLPAGAVHTGLSASSGAAPFDPVDDQHYPVVA